MRITMVLFNRKSVSSCRSRDVFRWRRVLAARARTVRLRLLDGCFGYRTKVVGAINRR
jgi:hypothetical protein